MSDDVEPFALAAARLKWRAISWCVFWIALAAVLIFNY